MGEVTACGVCGGGNLTLMLDMGAPPLAERMGEDAAYPLALFRCADCSLVQLSHIVSQSELFPAAHPYASGNTAAIVAHCRELAGSLTASLGLGPGDLAVDIGANDGTLLGLVTARPLPAWIEALPGLSDERYEAARFERSMLIDEARGHAEQAFPALAVTYCAFGATCLTTTSALRAAGLL